MGVVRDVYERYGFEPLETPAYENIETLLGKYGEEGNKLIFKILKRGEHEASGEADLALRYDLTVPLSRVVAQYQGQLPKLFKRYQIQPVWRAERPARGRFREFYQCDVDAIGSTSLTVEVELLSAASDVLTKLGFDNFRVRLNDRRLLTAILDACGIPPPRHGDALIAIDKLDKIGPNGVAEELRARSVEAAAVEKTIRFFKESGERVVAADHGLNWLAQSVPGTPSVKELQEIVQLSGVTPAAGRVVVDPSLARGLSYYTGAIMEISVPDLAGSLGGGGRYDNLIGMFLGRDVPACGFALGFERIILVMTEREMFPAGMETAAVDVMVTLWSDALRADALALAADLRRSGLRVDLYPEADKLGKQFKYAAARHVPFVVVMGDDERAANKVAVRNMSTGEQTTVAREELAAAIGRQRQ
jgi:histidyl-tRNA synthetase